MQLLGSFQLPLTLGNKPARRASFRVELSTACPRPGLHRFIVPRTR